MRTSQTFRICGNAETCSLEQAEYTEFLPLSSLHESLTLSNFGVHLINVDLERRLS
jgi:hypothetical protein